MTATPRQIEINELYQKLGSPGAVAKEIGKSKTCVIKHLFYGARNNLKVCFDPDIIPPDGIRNTGHFKYEEKETGSKAIASSDKFTSANTDRVKILSEFLKQCDVDLSIWEVERYVLNAWDVTMSGNKSHTGKDSTYTNYQIKVFLKRTVEVFDKEKFVRELIQDVKRSAAPSFKISPKRHTKDKNLFIPNLYDVHIGRLCWYEDSGENYDIKIAPRIASDLLATLFNRLNGTPVSRILFPIGNDFLNYDYATPYTMTTAGTPQESDARWQKMFRVGRNLLYGMVEWMCKEIAPVDIMGVPGNHDEQLMWCLGEVLNAKYEDKKHITVDNSPLDRKYYKYGQNLIGFAHGKYEKPPELHNLMSLESKKDWANTKYRYYYLGHNHYEKTMTSKTSKAIIMNGEDYKGVHISYLPSTALTDKYEYKRGYIGSIHGARGMVHHPDGGRTHIIGANI